MDQVLHYKNFDVLKNKFDDEQLRLSVRLLCVFGCGAEEAIYATHDDNVFGFGRNRFGGLGLGTLEEHIHTPRLNPILSGIQISNIFCGFEHWIALTESGRCYAWGHNQFGQLGIGSLNETQTPQIIDFLANKYIIDVSCGGFFCLALTVEREIYGWGHNQFGQLADGSFNDRCVPIRTKIECEVQSISCGIKHSMCVSITGTVYVWGLNSYGQLGRDRSHSYVKKPELISGFEVTEIKKGVCGSNHSLLLTSEGLVYAFGENTGGQVGNGDTEHQSVPYNIEPDVRFKDIIAHKENDISIAVSIDEKFYIWGLAKNRRFLSPQVIVTSDSVFDIYAQYTKKSVTFKTILINESLKNWEKIDSNRVKTNLNQSSDGSESKKFEESEDNEWTQIVRNRKNSHRSRLSSLSSTISKNDNKCITDLIDLNIFQSIGLPSIVGRVINDIRLLCVFGRGNSVLFVTKDDKVYGFGHNRNGCLGLGHWTEDIKKPELNRYLSQQQLVDIIWGFEHCIGLTSSGQCLTWGQNRYGQLGIGSYHPSNLPQLLKEFSDKFVVQICCGSYHTMVLTSDGEVFSWGHNTFAQLGDRTYNSRESPTPILIKDKVVAIACGLNHSVALTDTGSVYIWGVNEFGQLGRPREKDFRPNRDKPMCNRPQKIPYFDNIAFKKVVCGSNHTLLLSSDGNIFAFGDNSSGQIGNGSIDPQYLPFKITSLPRIKDIFANRENDLSIAITEDNKFYAWGLANNKREQKPVLVSSSTKTSIYDIYTKMAKNKVTIKAIDINEDIDKLGVCSATQNSPNNKPKDVLNPNIEIHSKISQILERFDFDHTQDEDKEEKFYDFEETKTSSSHDNVEDSEQMVTPENTNSQIPRYESNENESMSGNDDLSVGSDGQVIRAAAWELASIVSTVYESTPGDVFLTRLRQSFNNPNNFDLKVLAGDIVIHCHKTILKIRNEAFWQVLAQQLSDEHIWSTYSQVVINPMTGPAFHAFLQFMYGIEPTIGLQFVEDLLKMAQFFNEPELEELCSQLIQSSHQEINEFNVCSLYERAVNDGLPDLEKSCVEFVANNRNNVFKSDQFQAMNDNLSKGLLISVMSHLKL